jgi:DNA mismatch repair protein MutS
MNFIADKQTLEDLNIPGKYRPDSVFNLFNKTKTRGGERFLMELFSKPLTDPQLINERSAIFHYFSDTRVFPFKEDLVNEMEVYLSAESSGNILKTALDTGWRKLMSVVVHDEAFATMERQLMLTLQLLKQVKVYFEKFLVPEMPHSFLLQCQKTVQVLTSGPLSKAIQQDYGKLSLIQIIRNDHLLRSVYGESLKHILDQLFHLDVYFAVGKVAADKGFSYARALPKKDSCFQAQNLRHPCIGKAVGNGISLTKESNLLFLTGANMAGKSTFMKSFGIAVYLAHLGFPVAATGMEFSVRDGLYSSINLPDNLNLGYSHFYAEVKRVKKVAEEIARGVDLVVIFDELFKGTNVKDAYDATLAITSAFGDKKHCFFIISTHITEAGEELKRHGAAMQYVYFPSSLHNNIPTYTYRLHEGISKDRHGMMIIEKEGILQLIEGC